ncbi:hypothetical protein GQX73_g8399 [Xylaria multiplex]|uniref:DUF3517 domain-containing protein n=1 Tax=Xylaria multiplex TaxID=323545 RepID=A0A7C8MPP4_9PEZI|nr:hypothetical protein GQX73_g8399 [Xylaria multiplex]
MGNYVEEYGVRLSMVQQDDPIPFTAQEINILHKTWGRADTGLFADKLIQLNQNPVATDSIISRLVAFNVRMDSIILRSLLSGITGQITHQPVTPYLRASLIYCASSPNRENVHRLIRHISDQCKGVQNAEARSFFDFQKDLFDRVRNTGESNEDIRLHSLRNLPLWIPGLLGYPDRAVAGLVEAFAREKIFDYGIAPVFEETNGGPSRSRVTVIAARELAINILYYLRDTYVTRGAQASRDTMLHFHRILHHCDPYFREPEDLDDELGQKYNELRLTVLEAMHNLTVDEVEDDGSGMWTDSVSSGTGYD